MRRKQAFTLIELLVVMAITAVMMTLIVLPIFQSFNLTRNAQAFADAQDKARILTERIAREVGNAVSVRGGSSVLARINRSDVTDSTGYPLPSSFAGTSVIVRVPGRTGTVVETVLPNSKLDLIPPAQGTPDTTLGRGVFRNPDTGKIDPTMKRPKGDVRLPLAPGATIVRWWIGLARAVELPAGGGNPQPLYYNEPYTGLLQSRAGARDNLYVLRRAEVQPFEYRINKNGTAGTEAWRPNLDFFRSDDETDTQIVDLDDPRFFIPDQGQNPDSDAGTATIPGKNRRVLNWQQASVVQTEVSRYDMIRPVTTGPAAQPVTAYEDNNTSPVPRIVPLVQFVPTRIASAPAAGSAAARPGEAVDGLDRIGPDTFQTERGLWANAIARYYPAGYSQGSPMQVTATDSAGATAIYAGGTSGDGLDGILAAPDNFKLFDNTVYEGAIARGQAYPFTLAALAADQWDLETLPFPPGRRWTPEALMRQVFTPFRVITSTGRIVTSFPIEEVGTTPLAGAPRPNLPLVNVGSAYTPAASYSPTQATTSDVNYASAPLSPLGTGTGAYDPNRTFNRLWNAYPALQGLLERFIDLRMVVNQDGTFSPLNPTPVTAQIRGFSFLRVPGDPAKGSLNRVRIVPGSDEVYGPDQTIGAGTGLAGGYGRIVRYTRVSGNPGPNQYRLVYADLPEPTDPAGNVDYDVLGLPPGLTTGFDPNNYDPNNVVSAAIQPRFKAGYLQLCSDPNVPIPVTYNSATGQFVPGQITVRYRFQFNGPNDTFAVDYDTREVMQVLLTIKNYPQSNVPNAQLITLKSTATLRNALR